jgi:hypothetical protein
VEFRVGADFGAVGATGHPREIHARHPS